ncbi:hypothetical protein BC938DRAFT_476556 [Jimgerdemannia flammicorona]|uniref:Uncharacterized protein n=1 Tax=Jimgerdemannia flammicorona TaxID=994334 RepID=A0A433PG60_9FUNG|nr:hypothetical protein BC938DRAFT_476556 [Jimgerdemannia flammicorona]
MRKNSILSSPLNFSNNDAAPLETQQEQPASQIPSPAPRQYTFRPSSPYDTTTPTTQPPFDSLVRRIHYRRDKPFQCMLQEGQLAVSAIISDMDALESNMTDTQVLLNETVEDMRVTLKNFEDMKETSEENYHNLKIVEGDVEAINAKRAQNPWMDAGFAMLSYVLTFIAFLFWFAVQLIKACHTTVVFPRKLWKAYSA